MGMYSPLRSRKGVRGMFVSFLMVWLSIPRSLRIAPPLRFAKGEIALLPSSLDSDFHRNDGSCTGMMGVSVLSRCNQSC